MNEDIMKAEVALNQALDRLQKIASVGTLHNIRVSAEIQYGTAYQQLVKLHARPQVKASYRRMVPK